MTLFEQQENEDYYKPKRVNNFWNNNHIEYENDADKNRNLIKYFDKTNILTLIWVSFLRNLIEYSNKTNILPLPWVGFLGLHFEVGKRGGAVKIPSLCKTCYNYARKLKFGT